MGGGLTKCGVQSSAASFACLLSSGASPFAQHEAALGNFLKRCHLPALQLALEGKKGWTGLGAWKAHRGAVCLRNCGISVSKQCTSCCDLRVGIGGGEVGLEAHLLQSHYWAKVLGSQEEEAAR